jgi:hypothetical protein
VARSRGLRRFTFALTLTKPLAIAVNDRRVPATLARIGFAARGVIYLLIAGFALASAFRSDRRPHGFTTAVEALLNTPLGGFFALAIACGLACLAGWLAMDGLARARTARDSKRWLIGAAMIADALLYIGFMIVIVAAALGSHRTGDPAVQSWAAWLLALPAGHWLVGLVGGGLIAGGIGVLFWAWSGDVEGKLAMAPHEKHLTEPITRYGLTGRGAALAMLGVFLVLAAVDRNPSEAHELGGALEHLRHKWLGSAALLLFATAFAASAFFDFLAALYRRTEPGAD